MDLLGSILDSMEKPPAVTEKQKEEMKRQKMAMKKKQEEERDMLRKFREKVQRHITDFLADQNRLRLKYPPMEQVFRAVIHEVSEEAGVTSLSFGQEGVDRYIMLFKKEFPPCDDEIAVLRSGEEWTEEKRKEIAAQREKERLDAIEDEVRRKKKKVEKFVPNSNYTKKYEHLIGTEVAKEAAKVTQTNKQYGFVPSENKKDHRSIEETLADIKRKKRKLNEAKEGDT